MPPSPRTAFVLMSLALTACETDPVTKCAGPEQRELRTVEELIAETRARIDRGYTMERQDSGANVNFCLGGRQSHVGVSFCTDPGTRSRAVAIDSAAEQRKLRSLEARRDALRARINALLASCGKS
ncbi:hypothetical protein OEZ71_05930 [Defluviimonas sp. WL0050]|uniref:Lysozyme inhibitor LprI N-terminal domain-containing protein n=2 Tax=Albidovulum litorale TaxID=2984134 RepID=A0ABT2ZL22_9RHOB|nr:hypothetical protein [Defluviimonas sp. WL0050]